MLKPRFSYESSTDCTVYVSDGGSITWFDPPPFETVTDSAIISAVNKTLIRGFPDEELSCNFSLTADLSLITVSMKYGASTIATYLQSQQALSVDPTFVSRLNATWVPNKLTLILFSVTDAGKGEYRCEVVTYAGSVQTWVRKIQVSLVGKPSRSVYKIPISRFDLVVVIVVVIVVVFCFFFLWGGGVRLGQANISFSVLISKEWICLFHDHNMTCFKGKV